MNLGNDREQYCSVSLLGWHREGRLRLNLETLLWADELDERAFTYMVVLTAS